MKSRKPIVTDSGSFPDDRLMNDNVPGIIPDDLSTIPVSGHKSIRKQLANNSTGISTTAKRAAGNKRKSAGKASGNKPGRKAGVSSAIENRKAADDSAVSVPVNPDPSITADSVPVKKRGRPKGSKNTVKTSRKDRTVITESGENSRYLLHDYKLSNLPKIDINNPDSVLDRVNEYFRICIDDDIKPSVASLALAFSVSRYDLFNWMNDRSSVIKNNQSLLTLKAAYGRINSYYEHMMNNGKINPVAGIFMMKNNLGYKDTTDYIITPNNNNQVSLVDITSRAGLLEE